MKRGINLRLTQKKTGGVSKKVFIGSVIFFCACVGIGIVFIAYRFFLSAQLNNLAEREQQLNQIILSHNTKRDKLYDLHVRLQDIKTIINKRSKILDKVQYVSEIVPEDSGIKSIKGLVSEVSFNISSPKLSQINDLLEKRVLELALDAKKSVQKVEMKSLMLDPETREYSLNFSVAFK